MILQHPRRRDDFLAFKVMTRNTFFFFSLVCVVLFFCFVAITSFLWIMLLSLLLFSFFYSPKNKYLFWQSFFSFLVSVILLLLFSNSPKNISFFMFIFFPLFLSLLYFEEGNRKENQCRTDHYYYYSSPFSLAIRTHNLLVLLPLFLLCFPSSFTSLSSFHPPPLLPFFIFLTCFSRPSHRRPSRPLYQDLNTVRN